ncbi:MAG: HTH domain-containing protein [Myxococcota bacterium]
MTPTDRQDLILATLRTHTRRPIRHVPRLPWRVGPTFRVSAHELGRATGTSARTVYRDVEALRARGFRIGGMGGRGGGFWMDPESRPVPVALDVEDITRLALAMCAAPGETPDERNALLTKLLGALPNTVESELRALLGIVEAPTPERPVEAGVLTACRRAYYSHRPVRYLGSNGHASVLPEALVLRDGAWHLRGPEGDEHRVDAMRRPRVQLRPNPWPAKRFVPFESSREQAAAKVRAPC